jgi:hypothetical protein
VREHIAFLNSQEAANSNSLSATIAQAMSADYIQSAQRARALIEEIGAEKFRQDMSAKNTWLYEAAYQVEKVVKELFKTMEDQDQVMQVQVALEHTTTNEYMQGTLTNLGDEGGTLEFTPAVKQVFTRYQINR